MTMMILDTLSLVEIHDSSVSVLILLLPQKKANRLMAQKDYQVIITDINHYNSPVSGDAFILQNKVRLKDSAFIVFSGNRLE